MNTYLCGRLLPVLLAACGAQAESSTNSAAALTIAYRHAGLDRIEVKDGRMFLTWHTLRRWDDGELAPERQDMSSYDRHQVEVWLTAGELAGFRRWAGATPWAQFRPPFATRAGAPSYGAAFESDLTVVAGTNAHSLAWNGDSHLPAALAAAVTELQAMARRVEKCRRPQE
jgi:hypothetical protein